MTSVDTDALNQGDSVSSGSPAFELLSEKPDEASFRRLYGTYGACIIRRLIAPGLVSRLDAEAHDLLRLVAQGKVSGCHIGYRASVCGGEVFERIDPVSEYSPVIRSLGADAALTRFAGAAVGGRAALFKDKLIYKLPGDAGYDLHQDYPYLYECTMPADAVISVMIALDPMNARNGCLRIYSGYHDRVLPSPSGAPRDVAGMAVSAQRRHDVVLDPGDAVFFHPLAPHDSPPNLTAGTRRGLFFTYTSTEYAGQRDGYYRRRGALGPDGLFR